MLGIEKVIGEEVVVVEVALNIVIVNKEIGSIGSRPLMTKGNDSRICWAKNGKVPSSVVLI